MQHSHAPCQRTAPFSPIRDKGSPYQLAESGPTLFLIIYFLYSPPFCSASRQITNVFLKMQSDSKWISSVSPQSDLGTVEKTAWIPDMLRNCLSSSDGGDCESRSSLRQGAVGRQTSEAFKRRHKPSPWPDMRKTMCNKTFCPVPNLSQSPDGVVLESGMASGIGVHGSILNHLN